jgi:hypothetical protein
MLARMIVAGARACRTLPGTLLALYGVNLAFGLTFTVLTSTALARVFAGRPLFERGVRGDLVALVESLATAPVLVVALVSAGVALALLYFVVSQLLVGGLVERLRAPAPLSPAEARRVFGAGAAAHLGRFLRVWLWTWLLWLPALFTLAVGAGLAGRDAPDALTLGELLGPLALALLPGLVLATIASATGDYARLLAAARPELPTRRAVLAALRHVLTHVAPLAHHALHVGAWLLLTALFFLLVTALPAATPAWLLWLVRQAAVLSRTALRLAAYAGQDVNLAALIS